MLCICLLLNSLPCNVAWFCPWGLLLDLCHSDVLTRTSDLPGNWEKRERLLNHKFWLCTYSLGQVPEFLWTLICPWLKVSIYWNILCTSGIVLSTFHRLSYLKERAILWVWYGFYSHFTDREVERDLSNIHRAAHLLVMTPPSHCYDTSNTVNDTTL